MQRINFVLNFPHNGNERKIQKKPISFSIPRFSKTYSTNIYPVLSLVLHCTPTGREKGVANYLNIAKKKLEARFNESRGTLIRFRKKREKIIFNIENEDP